jgi:hypothetical protein
VPFAPLRQRMWAPAAGCGLWGLPYELVPSLMTPLYGVFAKQIGGHFLIFFNGHFLFPPKNKLSS